MLRTGLLMMALSGCSFVLVSGPPANHATLPAFDCTTSRLGPILDTVWTGLQGLRILGALSTSDAEWKANMDNGTNFASWSRSTDIAIGATLAGLGVAGMYYGFTRTSACKSAKNELNARQQGGGMGQPGAWPPPGQPGYPPAQPQPGYPPAQPQSGYPPMQPQP